MINTITKHVWINVLLTLSLAIFFLFLLNVPQNIQKGTKGQRAHLMLDETYRLMLDIKFVTSRLYGNQNATIIRTELEQLINSAEPRIQDYKQAAAYSNKLSAVADNFSLIYKAWINAEKKYLTTHSRIHTQPLNHTKNYLLNVAASENEALFLDAMQSLTESGSAIEEDIEKGRQKFQVLQCVIVLVVIYFFTLMIYFQYNDKRKHATREKNLEIILKSIGDAVIATDIHGNVTCMNPEAERLTGWSHEKADGYPLTQVFKVVNEYSGEPVEDLVERVKHEKATVVLAEESILIAANGNHYQIYENGAPIYDDSGAITGVVLVFKDITHAYELKNRINDESGRLQRIIDTSMDAVIVTNEQGILQGWNPAAELIFGWSFDEIRQWPIHESIIPKEFRERHLQGIERLVSSNQSFSQSKRIETLALHKDGHTFPIELAMVANHTGGSWMFNAFIRDLSVMKKNEKKMHKHDVLLRETQRVAKLGYWEFDFTNDKLDWSDEIFRIFALDPETSEHYYELFLNAIHPEDRERVNSAFSDSLKYKTPYNIIHRILTKDGEKIVHETCDTSYDDKGKPLRSLGLVQDITERTHNLDELRLSATMFKTHAGIMITETDGTIVRVNPAFEKMTGYSSEELVGKNPRILQSGKQSDKFYNDMWDSLTVDGTWQGELWNKRKDGEHYAEWLTITAVKDELGRTTNYVCTSQDITKRKQAELRVEHLAYHDDLTGLANRRLLHDRLDQNISLCKRHNKQGAVLLLDLDRFKDLNDSLGHSESDEILRQVASRLKMLMRKEDTIARLGGDEFVVVLSSVDDESMVGYRVQAIAEKIRLSLSEPYKLRGEQIFSSVSIGVALFPEFSDDIDDVLKHADTALYRAKAEGRNTVCFYQKSMQTEVDKRITICNGLRSALKNNEFILYYQPQVNHRGELFGAEALIRWEHPEHGMIPPDQFIPIAEETGLILDIGLWVIKEAARQCAEWNKVGVCQHEKLRLAINVSPRQFRQNDFVEVVLSVFSQAGVSPNCIELEVTESVLMDDIEEIVKKMEALRAHGIRIAIDDFGTGYSSLSYLKKMPIDLLKIDQSFVRDITNNESDAMVVETIIAMSRHLGLNVIAEGVESKAELDFLIEKGCSSFQGYYFSRPLKSEDFTRYIIEKENNFRSDQAL